MPSQTPTNGKQAPIFASLSRSSIQPFTDNHQTDTNMSSQTPTTENQAPTFASLSRSSIQSFNHNHQQRTTHELAMNSYPQTDTNMSSQTPTTEKQAPTFASLSRSSLRPYTDNHPRPMIHDPSGELRATSAREVHSLNQPPNPDSGLRTGIQTQAPPPAADPAPHRWMQARTAAFDPPSIREIHDNALAEPVNGTGEMQAPANHLSPSIPQQRTVHSTTADSDAADALNDRDQHVSVTEAEAQRRIQDHQTPAQEPQFPRQAPQSHERPAPNQAPELWPQVAYPVFPAAVGIPATNALDMGTGDSDAAGFCKSRTQARARWGANGTPAVAAERGSLREVRRRVEGDEEGC
ncbi:hypothetical protein G7Y79_00073g098130 [Physcia stellaris]|nr:hypothetical protein G7Y79_00073g098130 [Physcia stellaris]